MYQMHVYHPIGILSMCMILCNHASSTSSAQLPRKNLPAYHVEEINNCRVTINGGSVASFAAAVTAAAENVSTCLLEPTDWVGGQLTANGIPAVDFSREGYPSIFGSTYDTDKSNMSPGFLRILQKLAPPSYDTCWVSPYCFLPSNVVSNVLQQELDAVKSHLTVYYNTVPVTAHTSPVQGSEGKGMY